MEVWKEVWTGSDAVEGLTFMRSETVLGPTTVVHECYRL